MHNPSNEKDARLEVRITANQKEQIEYAARLQGRTVTDFLTDTMITTAHNVIEKFEVLKLTERDRRAFVVALLNPPPLSSKLRRAVKRHKTALANK